MEGAHRPPELSGAASRVPAHALLFPAAAAYAAVAIPISVAAMLGKAAALPGLAFPAGHAHELVFGFAIAAVAGNQLGPTRRSVLAVLLASWLLARAIFAAAPGHVAGALANGVFCATLAWQVAPRMLGRGKKLRNRALPAAVAALCAMGVASEITLHTRTATWAVLFIAILLLALLMLFMGGRIVAPAAAGQMYRQGGDLKARVQPRLEAMLIACMAVAIVAAASGSRALCAGALALAAATASVRMARWRLWKLDRRADLVALAAGYAWLALGLAGLAAAVATGRHIVTALHLITVGAMGTLTVNVMALTWLRLARRDAARALLPRWSTALIAIATFARVAADFTDARVPWLLLAAGAWSLAYVILLMLFVRARRVRSPDQGVFPGT